MTTLFEALPAQDLAGNSAYAPILEQVAPGICAIVDGVRKYGDTWPEVLQTNLPYISATDEQRTLLGGLAERAMGGSAPPSLSDLIGGEGPHVSVPWSMSKIAMMISIAVGASALLKG